MKRLTLKAILAAVAGVVFAGAGQADALSIRLTDMSTTVTVHDGGIGDMNPASGVVMYSGPVGNFNINVTTGTDLLATPSMPYVHLNSVDLSSSGGVLFVYLSDGNLALPPLANSALTVVGGVAGGTVDFNVYVDDANILFNAANNIGHLGPYTGAFSGTVIGALPSGLSTPFSLTQVAMISHSGSALTSFDIETTVPEPSTLLLLGSGLLGAGYLVRRRK